MKLPPIVTYVSWMTFEEIVRLVDQIISSPLNLTLPSSALMIHTERDQFPYIALIYDEDDDVLYVDRLRNLPSRYLDASECIFPHLLCNGNVVPGKKDLSPKDWKVLEEVGIDLESVNFPHYVNTGEIICGNFKLSMTDSLPLGDDSTRVNGILGMIPIEWTAKLYEHCKRYE